MIITRAKILLVAALALHMFLVFLNNVTDYAINFEFVKHALSMDTVDSHLASWRAVKAPWAHHFFYFTIILWELATASLCTLGSVKMWRNRSIESAATGRKMIIAGLTSGMLLWLVAFISVGGEWFLMWLSPEWNGTSTAYKLVPVYGIVFLIFLLHHSQEE